MADQPKTIISTGVVAVLKWHIWAVLSLSGTIILLALNFCQFAIGGELGGSPSSSANILGALQLVVKAHELSIVASLAAIVEQTILRDLFGGGLLLGLLGAEGAVGNPSFLISTPFRSAVKFGFREIYSPASWQKDVGRLRTLRLVFLMLCCCIIAGLAGPASGVLMIPRVNWHFHSSGQREPVLKSTLPTIMIGTSPGLLGGDSITESNVFAIPDLFVASGMRYWRDISGFGLESPAISLERKSVHKFQDYFGLVFVNTSGSYERPLDGAWTGATRITTTARNPGDFFRGNLEMSLQEIQNGWTDVKFVETSPGFDASVTCRAAEKLPCPGDSAITEDPRYPNWCYWSVHKSHSAGGEIRMGQNLLMSHDFVEGQTNPRLWLTEGPIIEENPHFSDSIEVLFEKHPFATSWISNLTVCSFSAVLVTAVATSLGVDPVREQAEYLDHVLRYDGTTSPPRKFLFHENWLDRAYSYDPDLWLSMSMPIRGNESTNVTSYNHGTPYIAPTYFFPTGSMLYPDNFTYAARPGLVPHLNSFGYLGSNLIYALGYEIIDSPGVATEAFPVEAVVGGILTYLLSWSLPSESQYSMPYDQIPPQFRLGPPESFGRVYSYEVYRWGYGFQLSSRTGYLGVAVLVCHAVIVIPASLWQLLKRRSFIHAWSTVPDYLCLGSGSPSLALTHPNTCAGVAGESALCGLVRIGETQSVGAVPHLQIQAVGEPLTEATIAVDLSNANQRYGLIGPRKKKE